MSNFNIQRARGTLPGRGTQVRANIDVRTGGQEIARAVSGFGEAMANVGLRYYLMEADTQLDKAKMQADEEHIRYMLNIQSIEDTSIESNLYKKAFGASMKNRRAYMPKNKIAARGYESYLTKSMAGWGLDTVNTKLAKQKDNFRGVGFELQQKAIESGDFAKYFTHLEKGRTARFDAYTDEEVAKFKQNTIDNHKRYVMSEEIRAKAAAKELHAQYVEQVEQEFLVKLRNKSLSENEVMNSGLDVDEKQEWLGYIEKQRERILTGADIITDQARKHELLDMAAAINWPDRKVTAQEVKKFAREGRYGTVANLDDAAFDEVRDAIRRAEEDKIPFTQKFIENIIGELITGAPSSVLGLPLPTLRTREDAIKHATNAFGRFVNRVPGVMDTINAKYPPEKRKSTPKEPKDTPAYDFDGELIGGYNPDGSITLNQEGVRRLWELAGRDIGKAREMALEHRYVIPVLKEMSLPKKE